MAGATSPPPERKGTRRGVRRVRRSRELVKWVNMDSVCAISYRAVRDPSDPVSRVYWALTTLVDPESSSEQKLTEAELVEIRDRYETLHAEAKSVQGMLTRSVPFELSTGRRLFASLGFGSNGPERLCISNHF